MSEITHQDLAKLGTRLEESMRREVDTLRDDVRDDVRAVHARVSELRDQHKDLVDEKRKQNGRVDKAETAIRELTVQGERNAFAMSQLSANVGEVRRLTEQHLHEATRRADATPIAGLGPVDVEALRVAFQLAAPPVDPPKPLAAIAQLLARDMSRPQKVGWLAAVIVAVASASEGLHAIGPLVKFVASFVAKAIAP